MLLSGMVQVYAFIGYPIIIKKEVSALESRVTDLRDKEIINVSDGCRFGYVGDVAVDLDTGRIMALIVPGRLRLFGLLGREDDWVFPWESVRRFGEDIILVEGDSQSRRFIREGRRRRT